MARRSGSTWPGRTFQVETILNHHNVLYVSCYFVTEWPDHVRTDKDDGMRLRVRGLQDEASLHVTRVIYMYIYWQDCGRNGCSSLRPSNERPRQLKRSNNNLPSNRQLLPMCGKWVQDQPSVCASHMRYRPSANAYQFRRHLRSAHVGASKHATPICQAYSSCDIMVNGDQMCEMGRQESFHAAEADAQRPGPALLSLQQVFAMR